MRLKILLIPFVAIIVTLLLLRLVHGGYNSFLVRDISKNIARTTVEMSASELKEYNGINGKPCYVAINGKVYNIPLDKTALWLEGKHVPSGGMAMCGKDLSTIIGLSPHGLSKLDGLDLISNYKP